MKGKIYTFPSKFVFYKQLDNHGEIKNQIYPIIQDDIRDKEQQYLQDHQQWDCKVITSFFDKNSLNLFSKFPLFIKAFWEAWEEMMTQTLIRISPDDIPYSSYPPMPCKISSGWYNIYKKGYSQEVHNHKSDYSVIYILNATESNKTVFVDHTSLLSSSKYKTEHMGEGTLIIFPSDLSHYVNPVGEDNRITLAMNINYI